jgi:hypothetical protein
VSTVTPSTLLASWTFDLQTNDVSGNGNDGQVIDGVGYTVSLEKAERKDAVRIDINTVDQRG